MAALVAVGRSFGWWGGGSAWGGGVGGLVRGGGGGGFVGGGAHKTQKKTKSLNKTWVRLRLRLRVGIKRLVGRLWGGWGLILGK